MLRIGVYEFYDSIPSFPQKSFPSLKSLRVTSKLSAWATLLEAGRVPPALKDLHVTTPKGQTTPEDGHAITRFFRAVDVGVPAIESLEMELWFKPSKDHVITFDALRPLASCIVLQSFAIRNPSGVDLSKADLRIML